MGRPNHRRAIIPLRFVLALSALDFSESGKPKVILLANKPFEFRCTVKGTSSELVGVKIKWIGPVCKGPGSKWSEITITGNDANGNITLERGM